jgi:hypothetical protein
MPKIRPQLTLTAFTLIGRVNQCNGGFIASFNIAAFQSDSLVSATIRAAKCQRIATPHSEAHGQLLWNPESTFVSPALP